MIRGAGEHLCLNPNVIYKNIVQSKLNGLDNLIAWSAYFIEKNQKRYRNCIKQHYQMPLVENGKMENFVLNQNAFFFLVINKKLYNNLFYFSQICPLNSNTPEAN